MSRFIVGLVALAVVAAVHAANPFTLTPQQINSVFSVPLWQDTSLWNTPDAAVSQRLGWPQESRTATLASYRSYPKDDARVLGARPFSLALYAERGKPTQVSMVFANKGDISGSTAMERDAKTIEAALKPMLGEPQTAFFGASRNMRYKVRRWDWKGHAILLEAPPDNYVGVRVLPTAVADREGRGDVISYSDLLQTLAQRVKRRPNGDVIVTEIPMVDQGPKGYCVPATWERYLRYLGIQADMYVLALAGQTRVGGGTSAELMAENAAALARRSGRRIDHVNLSLSFNDLGKQIDRGVPIMWAIFVDPELNKKITARSQERKSVTDWNAWPEKLKPARNVAKVERTSITDPRSGMPVNTNGHMCMIIGYNARTKEVAISDSWGKQFEERWTTIEEAGAMSQGDSFWAMKW